MTEESVEWVAWGVIGRPHGVHGELRAFPAGDGSPFEIEPGTTIQLRLDGTDARFVVESFRGAGKFRILSLEGISDREEAAAWTHAKVELSAELRDDLDQSDEFYADELIDALVVDESGASLGSVREIANYGAGDILIYGQGRERLMVPFADPYIVEVRANEHADDGGSDGQFTLIIRPNWIDE